MEQVLTVERRTAGTLFESKELVRAIDEIFRRPLQSAAADVLLRRFKDGIGDDELVKLVLALRAEASLCVEEGGRASREPRVVCSMGLAS